MAGCNDSLISIGGLSVREYEKRASRAGLIVVITVLVVQIVANEIPTGPKICLSTKLVCAVFVGVISYVIQEILPKLLLRKKELCGLYLIIYDDDRNSLCSIINIEYYGKEDNYSIDMYDCYLQGGNWVTVENQYPVNLDNIFYDLSPRGLHFVSNNDNYRMCIFIRFTYKTNSGSVMRYGSQKPFDRPYSGKLKKLSPGQLCEVFNEQYGDYHFCNLPLSKYGKCKYENRENCRQRERVVLNKVRKKGDYLRIAKVLYNRTITEAAPSGTPKLRRHKGTVPNATKEQGGKKQTVPEPDIKEPKQEIKETVR